MKTHSQIERFCNLELKVSKLKEEVKAIRKTVVGRIKRAGPQLKADHVTHAKWRGL